LVVSASPGSRHKSKVGLPGKSPLGNLNRYPKGGVGNRVHFHPRGGAPPSSLPPLFTTPLGGRNILSGGIKDKGAKLTHHNRRNKKSGKEKHNHDGIITQMTAE